MRKDDLFRLTEKRLFRYSDNTKQVERLKEELEALQANGDIKAQNYNRTGGSNHGVKNPVLEYVERVIKIEDRIAKLERESRPIERAIKELEHDKSPLSRDFLLLFRLFYCDRHDLAEIALVIGKNRRTLYRRRREFVKLIASFFQA